MISEYDDNMLIEELADRGIYVISLEEIRRIKEDITKRIKDKKLEEGILLLFDSLQKEIKEN